MKRYLRTVVSMGCAASLLATSSAPAFASSHREAPFITTTPKVDGTDLYAFMSYEPGRDGFVTLIANYNPLQDAYGGPNYFTMDENALYKINVDNNGDAIQDLTFQFRFNNTLKGIALPVGGKSVAVPVVQVGGITAANAGAQNVLESYTVDVVRTTVGKRGKLKTSTAAITNASGGSNTFAKPIDNIGTKTIADYGSYASAFVYNVNIPGCSIPGRLFVGQRRESFAVNLGETFDLINYSNPIGAPDGEKNTVRNKNITSLELEVHKSCLVSPSQSTVGVWTTADLPISQDIQPAKKRSYDAPAKTGKKYTQVSRLGMPLVNEVVIGIPDKNKFNASEPKDDGQFLTYVTNPTLPAIIEVLFGSAGVKAPTLFPRADLISAFLTGVDGLNKTRTPSEMLRLNTAIAATPFASQKNLGVLAGDNAGFPNGRRPGDDVVDSELRVAMGVLLTLNPATAASAPSGSLPFTDGATVSASDFLTVFPYLTTPVAGSPDTGQY